MRSIKKKKNEEEKVWEVPHAHFDCPFWHGIRRHLFHAGGGGVRSVLTQGREKEDGREKVQRFSAGRSRNLSLMDCLGAVIMRRSISTGVSPAYSMVKRRISWKRVQRGKNKVTQWLVFRWIESNDFEDFNVIYYPEDRSTKSQVAEWKKTTAGLGVHDRKEIPQSDMLNGMGRQTLVTKLARSLLWPVAYASPFPPSDDLQGAKKTHEG